MTATLGQRIAAMADPFAFDFPSFHALVAELADTTGSERLAVFEALPESLQRIAFLVLATELEAQR